MSAQDIGTMQDSAVAADPSTKPSIFSRIPTWGWWTLGVSTVVIAGGFGLSMWKGEDYEEEEMGSSPEVHEELLERHLRLATTARDLFDSSMSRNDCAGALRAITDIAKNSGHASAQYEGTEGASTQRSAVARAASNIGAARTLFADRCLLRRGAPDTMGAPPRGSRAAAFRAAVTPVREPKSKKKVVTQTTRTTLGGRRGLGAEAREGGYAWRGRDVGMDKTGDTPWHLVGDRSTRFYKGHYLQSTKTAKGWTWQVLNRGTMSQIASGGPVESQGIAESAADRSAALAQKR